MMKHKTAIEKITPTQLKYLRAVIDYPMTKHPHDNFYDVYIAQIARYGKYDGHGFNTWDYAWTYTNFLKQRYSIVSKINLIENTGIEEGTGKNPKKLKNLKKKEIKNTILHPKKLTINNAYDLYSSNNIYSLPKLLWRIKNKLNF